MLITLSSASNEPQRFTNYLKEPIVIEPDSKIALIACYLNKKREIDIPESNFSTISGEYSRNVEVPAQTLTDTAPFCTWLTNTLNQNAGIMEVTWTVDYDYGYAGFQDLKYGF